MAQSSSAAASTSTSTAPNSDHDVFINHRGLDVKKNFASHLYRRLQSYGLRVFLDQPELQRGDYFAAQIEEAIRYASVHVAIFSSGYAESTWCLRELVLMLQSNSPVIPVFYKVKPEELRWTRGKEGGYAKALEGLEKKMSTDPQTGEEKLRYDPSLIQNWRNALSKAAGISGFELEACNGDEGELVDNVVEEVLKRVKKPVLNVAKYPTGLDDKVIDLPSEIPNPNSEAGDNASSPSEPDLPPEPEIRNPDPEAGDQVHDNAGDEHTEQLWKILTTMIAITALSPGLLALMPKIPNPKLLLGGYLTCEVMGQLLLLIMSS